MPFQKVNGSDYYYELHGSGQPLVLIAGYTCDHTFWLPVVEPLSKHYQVLIFDNRGCGQTKDQNQPLTLKELAKDIVELTESLGLKKPHILGQSMGGTLAQIIAAEYAEKISKLILLVTTAKWRQSMLLGLKSLLDMRKNNLSFDEIFYATISWAFGEAFLSDRKMVEFLYDIFKNNPYPQSLEDQTRQFALLEEFDGRKLKISTPTMVINAREDIIALPHEAEELARRIGAKHKMLEGAHGVIAESSGELLSTLHQFLSS